MRQPEQLAAGLFAASVLFAAIMGDSRTIIAGAAVGLMVLGAYPNRLMWAFLAAASVILLLQRVGSAEGFTDASGTAVAVDVSGTSVQAQAQAPAQAQAQEKVPEKKEGFSAPITNGKPMLPDNGGRREFLELGKPYKLPSENDDKGVHLDAGTTFLNAYKALKPDQIAAMTRDTQELLETQKSLVAMLDSFAPLMKDMGKITGFLGMK